MSFPDTIEKNKKAYNIIKTNFLRYQADNNISLIFGDSLKICKKLNETYDVIYVDPPYFSGVYEASIETVKNICNGIIILEHVVDLNLPKEFQILKQKKYADKYITFIQKLC